MARLLRISRLIGINENRFSRMCALTRYVRSHLLELQLAAVVRDKVHGISICCFRHRIGFVLQFYLYPIWMPLDTLGFEIHFQHRFNKIFFRFLIIINIPINCNEGQRQNSCRMNFFNYSNHILCSIPFALLYLVVRCETYSQLTVYSNAKPSSFSSSHSQKRGLLLCVMQLSRMFTSMSIRHIISNHITAEYVIAFFLSSHSCGQFTH